MWQLRAKRGRGCQIAFAFVLDKVHLEHPQTKPSAVRYLAGLQSVVLCQNGLAYCLSRRYRIPSAYSSDAKSEQEHQPFRTLVDNCVPIATSLVGALPCQSGSGLHRGSRRLVWGRKRRASQRQAIATRCPCLLRFRRRQAQGVVSCLTLVGPGIHPCGNKVRVVDCRSM
ncbi:hypothetical protein GGI42DRAFT_35905 [Trichoderma sp. SZMC 28013]